MVSLINKINSNEIKEIHISQFKDKTNKMFGFKAIGTNTTSNNFCLKMYNPKSKTKVNKTNLENNINLMNYVKICNANKWCNFALWTKRKDIIQKFFDKHTKPDNLIIVYSNPIIDKPIHKTFGYFDKVFNNVTDDNLKELQNCTGQRCIDCLRCYNKSQDIKDNIIFEKTKKQKKDSKNICESCYSHRTINFRSHTMVKPLQNNSNILTKELEEIQIPKIIDRFFRFNHHGELIS